jgi:hypothetical protein
MVQKEITADTLIVFRKELDPLLAKLHADSPSHREIVLNAIVRLVDDYMSHLDDIPLTEGELIIYPPEQIVLGLGDDYVGNLMNLFNNSMAHLSLRPTKEKLQMAVHNYIKKNSAPEECDRFYRCWAAAAAYATMLGLLNFLKYQLPHPSTAAPLLLETVKQEQQTLSRLLTPKLPLSVKNELGSACDYLKNWLKE